MKRLKAFILELYHIDPKFYHFVALPLIVAIVLALIYRRWVL